MNQAKLIQISMNMNSGQAYPLTRQDMLDCAEGMLSSKIFDSVRESDIEEFTKEVSENWGVSFECNPTTGNWTMHKR